MSTDTKNTQKLSRREILEKELDLDPIEKIKIKRQEKHQNAIKKLKQPKQIYDHESKALDSIAGCKYGGPRV